jgi:hypothetical protein
MTPRSWIRNLFARRPGNQPLTRKAITMNTILVNVAALLLALTDPMDTNEPSDPSEGFIDGTGI